WRDLSTKVIDFDTSHYERRDQMAFEMAERGDMLARDTLLRIIQRDADPEKRARAERLVRVLDGSVAAD
ncbi:MAG: hypothetical protein ISP41_01585, partial [Alphaproteobacteria bacterium]|nr:hypothetical protein [Alphaproteobacteria bacterium]